MAKDLNMKVLICTNHFYPETFRCNDVAFELVQRGYDVTVMTAIPDYPKGKFFDGYGIFRKRKENVKGVKVYRAFIIPRGNGGAIRLMLNYVSFFISSILLGIYLGLFQRFDKILVHETSPVMIGVPAVIVKRLQKIPLFFWVLDLWPESLQAAGGINNPRILGMFDSLTRWIYSNSDKILMSSKGFEASITQKGDLSEKLVYFPNWADRALGEKAAYQLPAIPQGFIVMFAGNIGEAQDFDHIMDAALRLKQNKNIHFVLVGDGRKRTWVESFCKEHKLVDTVHWVGRHPIEAMPVFFEKADIMLMTLKDVSIFNLTAPAKLQAYMSASKPILAMMNGEGPRVINEAQCGRCVPAGDSEGLAEALLEIAKMDRRDLEEMGLRGKDYQQKYFNLDKSIDLLCKLFVS